MDIYGYKAHWTDTTGRVASTRLEVFHKLWFLSEGHHPALVSPRSIIFEPQLQRAMKAAGIHTTNAFQVSPIGDVWGHNLATDNTNAALVELDTETPISPLYARDLAGRVVYLGIGPHQKNREEWAGDRQITLPRFCSDIDAGIMGADLIEQVFFTKFRCLDMSLGMIGRPTQTPNEAIAGLYAHQNLYPYKVRLDTFYTDGWKLPQMEAVYARTEGISIQQAESAAEGLMQAWTQRPHGQGYEDFYEALGGADYFTDLFAQGCTLIPTFEACNGYNKLSRQFELHDFWPGRAVPGLHDVVERHPHYAPEGTILEVRQPGVVLGHRVHPAKVVVSDGTGYTSPHHTDPDPLLPDVRLPHTRSVAKWGQCWLPTHPKHFERPAISGWDAKTGIFMQIKGPLWDPLHYFYGSVDEVLKAYTQPALPGNRWLIPVPAHMKTRFYPITPLRGFDTLNVTFRDDREDQLIRPFTSGMRFDDGKYSCHIGYHPLPVQYEYELDNWWFPELDPRHRATPDVPLDVEDRLCPVIECPVMPDVYRATVVAPSEAPWLKDMALMAPSSGNPLEDYPSLKRYRGSFSEKTMQDHALVYLAAPLGDEMDIPSRELAARFRPPAVLEEHLPSYAQALLELAEDAAKRYQFRHQSYRKDPDGYQRDWWQGVTPIVRSFKPPVITPDVQTPDAPATSHVLPTTEERVRPRGISAASLKGPVVIE